LFDVRGCQVPFSSVYSLARISTPHNSTTEKEEHSGKEKVVVEYIDWAAQLGCISFDGVCIVDFTLVRNAELFWAWWEAGRSRGTFPFLVCAGQIHLFDE
jgi:hypothetical protein